MNYEDEQDGNPLWTESDEFASAFQYRSIFQYSKLTTDEMEFDQYLNESKQFTRKENVMRNVIILFSYLLLIFTFPISAWFCVKRIKPLERCIVHRLGRRLPIKGPGLTIRLPFIDVIDLVDLQSSLVYIGNDKTLLTSDRSIIEFKGFQIEISVLNVVRTFTKMKDPRRSVENFVSTAFPNVVASTHIEDFEFKLEYVIRKFISACNIQLNDWGWNSRLMNLPTIKIVQRSDPTNPLIQALKDYFSPGNVKQPKAVINSLPNIDVVQENFTTDEIMQPLKSVASKYTKLKYLGYKEVNISITIKSIDQKRLYQFNVETGDIKRIENGEIHVQIIADNLEDFNHSIQTEDTSKITLNSTLF